MPYLDHSPDYCNNRCSALVPCESLPLSSAQHKQPPLSSCLTLSMLPQHRPLTSSSFFNNAPKAYEKRTKNDLLPHPLAAQFQACDSPSAVVFVLQQQVQELNQSRSGDGRLTNWLGPTVNVLYAFSLHLERVSGWYDTLHFMGSP